MSSLFQKITVRFNNKAKSLIFLLMPEVLRHALKHVLVVRKRRRNDLKNYVVKPNKKLKKVSPLSSHDYIELINFYISESDTPSCSKDIYLAGADWARILQSTWINFDKFARMNNIEECASFLENFFRSRVIEGFWGETVEGLMEKRRIELFRDQLLAWIEISDDFEFHKLAFPEIGNPWGFDINQVFAIEPSMEYVFYAQQIAKLTTGIANPKILEIGGGFGGLAFYLKKIAPNVKYFGMDVTENLVLQKYFLTSAFGPGKVKLIKNKQEFCYINQFQSDTTTTLLPNRLIEEFEDNYFDIVVNFRSFAEMPSSSLSNYLKQSSRISKRFIYHENLYKERRGDLHGITTEKISEVDSFNLSFKRFSIWPKYNRSSDYPCAEYLLLKCKSLHKS